MLDIAHRAVDASIVDENIETRKFRAELFEYPVDILRLTNIADDCHNAGAGSEQRRKPLLLGRKLVGAASAEHHAGAIGNVVPRDLGPQPLASPGDQREAAFQLHRTLPATM